MLKIGALAAVVALLAGCVAAPELARYGVIDQTSKTVTVPPGSDGLKGRLKQALNSEGWKMVVGRGPTVTEGAIGSSAKVEQFDTFNSRYRLVVTSRQYDICLNMSPAIVYDLSFIDNLSSSEVFTLAGKGCESTAVEKFVGALQGR